MMMMILLRGSNAEVTIASECSLLLILLIHFFECLIVKNTWRTTAIESVVSSISY